MLVSDFDYDLPEELIAQEPAARRDGSRLLVLDRASGKLTNTVFSELPAFLRRGDLLVLNNTKVFAARLDGRRQRPARSARPASTGRRVEVFLVRKAEPVVWEALVRPARAVAEGDMIDFSEGALCAKVIAEQDSGRRLLRFEAADDEVLQQLIDRIGRTPLPPYIKREKELRLDAERYQTVFARERGAIAAPTAGLHFTDQMLVQIRDSGVEIAEITLHVGYGTFMPVRVERVDHHRVEAETYSINETAASAITRALAEGSRVIAVGTTTTRALESAWIESLTDRDSSPGLLGAIRGVTELFIHPGFKFRVIDGLITNFHLPKSSLLMLVSAFGGREQVLAAYRHAIGLDYRFYSYGDAMLII